MKCGFASFKENKHQDFFSKRDHSNIVLFKTKLNTIYSGTHDIYLERISHSSPRNGSPLFPRKQTEYFNEVMLQSFNNGTTIRILDVQENRINIDQLYSFSTLKHMQVKIIDPDEPDYANDCLVYCYEYINFLKEHNVKYPFSELYVLYNVPDLENAFWNGSYLTFGNGSKESYPFVSAAIVAHELTHSLIQSSINLEYYGDSGALNESYCDIIGVMFEFWLHERHNGIGYELGSELFKDGHSLRSFADPNKCGQPTSIRDHLFYRGYQDNGGVHINSSLTNHCFYKMQLLRDKKIIFDLFMKVFFKLRSNTNFSEFKHLLLTYIINDLDLVNIVNEIL